LWEQGGTRREVEEKINTALVISFPELIINPARGAVTGISGGELPDLIRNKAVTARFGSDHKKMTPFAEKCRLSCIQRSPDANDAQ
jgi:hypothetical protein